MERLHQTREEAIKWHRKMWEEMGIIEGDDCTIADRVKFKKKYVQENFPEVDVTNNCFLCCYALNKGLGLTHMCEYCPLKWGHIENYFDCENKYYGVNWKSGPCSLIAGLEERTDNI